MLSLYLSSPRSLSLSHTRVQDPARARLHEEMSRLTRRINVGSTEVDSLSKATKVQAKRLAKLRKDLAALTAERVRVHGGIGLGGWVRMLTPVHCGNGVCVGGGVEGGQASAPAGVCRQ